ncbi:hypothetical protein ACF09C_06605 [Streptomyces sp. NPDC014870]|uniref:hypothetical protein n=1 Tax=Streptomyces sp. NPDC014870 TaxID=3364925 RepID=UPI0036FF0A1A
MRAIRGAATALLAITALCLAAPTAGALDDVAWIDVPSSDGSAGTADGGGAVGGGGTADGGAGDGAVGGGAVGGAAGDGAVGGGAVGGAPTGEGTGHDITSFGFSVSPATVAPGGTVTLTSDGCEVGSVTVTSGIFDTVTLKEGHSGTATVDVEAKAGAEYQVTFDCKGEKGTTPITIVGDATGGHETGGQDGGTRTTTDTGAHKGVKAGFGGGADAMGAPEAVMGGVLIAGALGAGGVLLARRHRRAGDRA